MIPAGFNLENKVALVVGTGRGWQADIAGYLAEAGAKVAVVGGDAARMEKAKSLGDKVKCITADISDARVVDQTVADIIGQWGRIDILVNNGDEQFARPLLETTAEDWARVLETNLTSVFRWTQAVGKHMLEQESGSVINMCSVLSERGLPNCTAYCATSGAVAQFTKALALEWGRQKVRVNAIGVGWTERQGGDEKAEGRLQRYITAGRFCQAEDIAAMLVYLASPAASYVTGQTYFVSGGVMSHG